MDALRVPVLAGSSRLGPNADFVAKWAVEQSQHRQTASTPLGLRDRKRLQTRERMERTAVELVLRDGLQGATVDAICEVAEVSTRTFFNYFDSKEDAILGLPHLEISEAAVLERATKNDGCEVVADVIGLIHQMTAPVLERGPLHKPRKILHRYPELAARQIGRLSRVNDDVLKAVHIFMRHDPRFTYLAGARSPLAELVLALCTSAVRTSAREWIAARSDASIDTVRTRAIALAREVIEKLL